MRLAVFCLALAVASANNEPNGSSPGYPNPSWSKGWCHNFKQLPDENQPGYKPEHGRSFFHKPTSPTDCAAKCKAHPDCTQAVYEEGGPWGQECWLGGQTSEKTERDSRACNGQGGPCVDHCYHPALDQGSDDKPKAGFTTLEAAAAFLGVPTSELGKQTPAATGAELHWSNKLPASMWQPCSHTFCKMEKRKCSVNKHPNNGGFWQTGHWCPETMTMRVYHNGRENMGRAHHCHVPSHQNDGKCVCECAHESVLDRLGDMFSGLTTAASSQCEHPSVWGAGQKCSGAELASNPKGLTAERVAERYRQNLMVELGVHKDDPTSPHFCQYLCEDLGASCVRFNKATGKCQCFAGAATADATWGNGDVVDAACKANSEMAHVHDMSAALHWYEESAKYGSTWGKQRAEKLKQFKTLHGSWHK